VRSARNWRFGYARHFLALVEAQAKSPAAALKCAKAGLGHMHEAFEFVGEDGETVSFREAMTRKNSGKFHTGFVQGAGKAPPPSLSVPYKGGRLEGEALKRQVEEWVEYGTIERSAGDAICGCVDNPKRMDLSDKYARRAKRGERSEGKGGERSEAGEARGGEASEARRTKQGEQQRSSSEGNNSDRRGGVESGGLLSASATSRVLGAACELAGRTGGSGGLPPTTRGSARFCRRRAATSAAPSSPPPP
jgi:hypothetical protein